MKTVATNKDVEAFVQKVEEGRRNDVRNLINLCSEITGFEPVIWGDSIIGFGQYHYVYESGREGDFFLTGFSPRKRNLVLYIMSGLKRYENILTKLGPHKTGKSCLYLSSLSKIDEAVLKELITRSVSDMKKKYP